MNRKFSRRARRYILAYFYLEHEQEDNRSNEGTCEINIERIQKEFKTQHRSAIDFDEKFINHCLRRDEHDPAGNNSRQQQQQTVLVWVPPFLLFCLVLWWFLPRRLLCFCFSWRKNSLFLRMPVEPLPIISLTRVAFEYN